MSVEKKGFRGVNRTGMTLAVDQAARVDFTMEVGSILLLPGVYITYDTSGLQQGGSARGVVQPGVSSNGARANMVNYKRPAGVVPGRQWFNTKAFVQNAQGHVRQLRPVATIPRGVL
jgi:hypothetical protein